MGAYHARSGVPNQDAIAWLQPGEGGANAILAVADGHGASRHFRSGVGAHMAVEAATVELAAHISDPRWIATANATEARALIDAVVARWRELVMQHIAANPLDRGGDPFVPYGATLIAAAATPAGIFVFQIGDGDLLLAGEGGITRPLPNDIGMIGEETYSICQPDAAEHARWHFVPADAPVDFLMLASDGLFKSFADEDAFHAVARYWRGAAIADGLPAVLERIDTWLSDTTFNGSGDDITVGFMVKAGAPIGAHRPAELPSPRPRPTAPQPAPRKKRWRWF